MNFNDLGRQIDMLIGVVENDIHRQFQQRLNAILAMYDELVSSHGVDGSLDNLNKYNRLNKMIEQLESDLTEDYSTLVTTITYAQLIAFIHSTVGSAFLLSALTGLAPIVAFPKLPSLRDYLTQDIEDNALLAVIQSHRNDMAREVRRTLRSSVNDDINVTDTRRKLKRISEKYMYKAQNLSTHEIGRAESIAEVDIGEKFDTGDNELKRIWMSQRDIRVRHTHKILNGQASDSKGLFYSKPTQTHGPAPRLMVGLRSLQENMNCRCSVGYRVNGIELDYLEHENMSDDDLEVYEKTSYDKYLEYIEKNKDNIHPSYYKQISKGMAWDKDESIRDKKAQRSIGSDSKKFKQMLKRGFHKKKDGSWGY